jgi:hypothetical protein
MATVGVNFANLYQKQAFDDGHFDCHSNATPVYELLLDVMK